MFDIYPIWVMHCLNLNHNVLPTPVSLEQGSSYTDAGASASDNVDGDITADINTISTVNTVDTAVVGDYTVTYTASDAVGNAAVAVVRTVTVTPDVTTPVVTPPLSIVIEAINGTGTLVTNETNVDFLDAATATDVVDGMIAQVSNDAPDKKFPLGVTTVTFSATDSTGNTGTAQATVTVTEKTASINTLVVTMSSSIELDGNYTDWVITGENS